MSDLDSDLPVQDELSALKARADMLGVNYHPSIKLDKLREKVNAATTFDGVLGDNVHSRSAPTSAGETENQMRNRLKKEASSLVRIRVTCMNPAKAEWEGEMFTCGNSVVGTYTKYVPFNNEEGWHVPNIILQMMQDRQCQIFVTVKDSRGNQKKQGKLIKEFAIEILDPLTQEELGELARRQAIAQTI